MPGNVRIVPNAFYDPGFLNQALGGLGVTQILTEPNGTVECTMTTDQVTSFQTRFPQYQLIQLSPVPPDQPLADSYADQSPPTPDTALEGGETVTPDPSPN